MEEKTSSWKNTLKSSFPHNVLSFFLSFISFITFAKDNWEDRGIGRVCGNLMCFIFKYFSVFLLNVAVYWKKLKKENITPKEQEEAKKKTEYISNRNPSKAQIVIPATEFCIWVLKRVAMLGFQSGCWWAMLCSINETKESTHWGVREGGVTETKSCFTGKRGWSPTPGRASYMAFACDAATARELKALFKIQSLKFQNRQTRIQNTMKTKRLLSYGYLVFILLGNLDNIMG